MPNCTKSGVQIEKFCDKTRDDGYDSCKEYRDDGYNSRDRWDQNCCDWVPCSWACRIITWLCAAWIWISNVVCVVSVWVFHVVCIAWRYVTTAVCQALDALVTIVSAIVETIESIAGWVLSAFGAVIEFFLSIPIVGRLLGWALGAYQTVIWFSVGLLDTFAGLLGIHPEKKLRICTIILSDENQQPIVTAATVVPWLQKAVDVYKQEANIRVIPVAPFHYSSGFAGNETVTEDWIHVSKDKSGKRILDLGGEAATLGSDLTDIGSDYNKLAIINCFYGTWRKVVGYGAPITVFVIRSLEEGIARSLGPLTDYIVIGGAQQSPVDDTTVAHEMGHACYLVWHDSNQGNLMFKTSPQGGVVRGTSLDWLQVTLVRSSRHVTYF